MPSRKSWLFTSVVVAVLVYATMWIGYAQNWLWLDDFDTELLQTFHNIGASRPGWVTFWDVFCTVLGPIGFRAVGLVLLVVALVRRNVSTAVFLVVSIGLMGVVTESAKYIAGRPRPAEALVFGASTSFPSGHALGVMVGVLALLAVLWPSLSGSWRRILVVLGAVLIIVVGVARVILNVHHPSDVLAGWALGYLYYLLCVRLVPPRGITATAETRAVPGTSP